MAYEEQELRALYERTMPSLYRLCYSYVKNKPDTQDLVHNTYMKLLHSGKRFDSEEHEKAWLIVTARNLCKNHLRHWWRRTEPLENAENRQSQAQDTHSELRDAVLALPERYKTVIFLYYYEGYDTGEIAGILGKNPSTVRRQLMEARQILGGNLREEES